MAENISVIEEGLESSFPKALLVVPVQTPPIFPGILAPLALTKDHLIETVEQAMNSRGLLGLVLARPAAGAPPTATADVPAGALPSVGPELHEIGTLVRVVRRLNNPEGGATVLVYGVARFRIVKTVRSSPVQVMEVEYPRDTDDSDQTPELEALSRAVMQQVNGLADTSPFFTEEMRLAMANAPSSGSVADVIAFALSLKREDAQELLATFSVKRRFEKLLYHLKREQELTDLQRRITQDVGQKIHKAQREYFLKEQLRSIRRELGGEGSTDSIVERFRKRLSETAFTDEARKVASDEIARLEHISEHSPEHQVVRTYLETLFALPWGKLSTDRIDLKGARLVLDEDHYGIEKVKERILEFLAVRKMSPKAKGSVLCLVGPPGVGKTSLGKSIARAMGRNFFRFSLGGTRDEAEIKGHRRTYVGAMPGKVLTALKRAGTANPVLLLDEIDKLGMSFQGDPASALLEVLDPEQNHAFLDHYLDVPFDLSHVLFILTANSVDEIPAPLLDRMEVVELSGYTLEEKQQIAIRHVVPRELEKHGLNSKQLEFTDEALLNIAQRYAREPGMRTFQQQVARVCRKVVAKVVETEGKTRKPAKVVVQGKGLEKYLGIEKFDEEAQRRSQEAGVVTGLAWTPLGGKVLFVEACDIPKRIEAHLTGKEKPAGGGEFGPFKVTGQIGDVMNESATIAYSFVRKKFRRDQSARRFFDENEIHVHVPAGAVKKDGPSAGVTLATALVSLVTGKKTKPGIAMTGELSLVGKVLSVGGIREKVLAAKRVGIHTIILPRDNKKDLKEIPAENLKGLSFVFADKVDDVFRAAF